MASITTRKGRRCTAVPKLVRIEAVPGGPSSTSTSTSTSEISSSSSTSTSTSSSSSSSSSSPSSSLLPSSISSSTVVNSPPAIANPAQQDTPLPSEIFSSPTSIVAAQPSADPAIPAAPPAPTVTGTDGVSSSAALLLDTASTPTPTQPGAQVSSSAGQDDNPVQSTSPLFEQPVDSSSLTSSAENTSLPTIGVTQASSSSAETETRGTGLPTTQKAATGNAITTEQTIAIAAGVVGGVIAISLVAFIIWFWRKRRMEERRNSMLPPMSPRATFRGDEKGPYLISRTSLGPTPLPQKLWATISARYRRLRGRVGDIVTRSSSPSPSVNLDRGTSQFGLPEPAHSRNNSNTGPSTDKGRPVDWWGRLTEDENSNWQLRRESENNGPAFGLQPGRGLEKVQESSINGNRRRSVSVGNEQHFLGNLGLDFDSANPFSDVNAIGNNTAKATPLVVSAVNNPFSDSHAIGAPSGAVNGGIATYVQHSQHSHSHSMNGSISRQTSNASYRTSVGTIGTRRNRFRSDPFDLDRPDFLRSANSSMDATAGWASRASRSSTNVGSVPNAPQQAHVRNLSFTSKYSSGASNMGWSDPGPDIGPVVGRYTPSPDGRPERRDSDRKNSKSQGSVGKAL